MNKILLCLLFFAWVNLSYSYEKNPFKFNAFSSFTLRSDSNLNKEPILHSPKKASIYSAVLPGLGQAYNKKYWKIPIVFAALGTSTYFIIDNREKMLKRQNALKSLLDSDSTTNPSSEFANVPIEVLKAERNFFRTYRDYSIIATAVLYVLNIVDAAVDAHFYKFNIDQPLAERKTRHWHFAGSRVNQTPTFGLSYTF
jgi:hypothetical protein